MAKANIDVQCPCCHSTLKIDSETGAVLTHKEPERPKPIEDMVSAVANLKTEAARREEIFQKSLSDQKTRQSVLDKKFDELFKEVQSSPDKGRPQRDIDLD